MMRISGWLWLLFFIGISHYVYAASRFVVGEQPGLSGQLTIDAKSLCDVASNTHDYLVNHSDDSYAVHDGVITSQGATLERVKTTLAFICQVYREDIDAGVSSRLESSQFLQQHFEFIRWLPDRAKAERVAAKSTNKVKTNMLRSIPEQQIFLTKYYTKLLTGSEVATKHYSQALYQLPYDEKGLNQEQALKNKERLTRFKYTRQQVIDGALLKQDLAKPLVWITEEALHDVLLQGTGVLEVNGKTRYFNVHRNNGIAYDYHMGKREQARYWYFAEVPSIMGYGRDIDSKIALSPQVSVAGNVKQLGLGKLFMFEYQINGENTAHMAVLADEGGAFDDNLFQLDLLVGNYYGWKDYHQANKHLPDYVTAWVMVLKENDVSAKH